MQEDNVSQQGQMHHAHVSLVDENDNVIGSCNKYDAHRTDPGPRLHRAFSLFLFDDSGRLLLQQRAPTKLTFPLIWANTCCSHPEPEEPLFNAAIRRVKFEVGLDIDESNGLFELGAFRYMAQSGEWTEYEIDHVIFGKYNGPVDNVNQDEVFNTKWVTKEEFEDWIAREPEVISPWLRKIWSHWLNKNWNITAGEVEKSSGVVNLME